MTRPGLGIACSLFSPTTRNHIGVRVPYFITTNRHLSALVQPTGCWPPAAARSILNATGPGGPYSLVSRAPGLPLAPDLATISDEHGSHCKINSSSQVVVAGFPSIFSQSLLESNKPYFLKRAHLKGHRIIHKGLRSHVSAFPSHSTRRSVLVRQHL